jgi:hypothetical protein
LEVGVPFSVTLPAPCFSFVTLRFVCQVTALESPRMLRWTGRVPGVSGHHRFIFEDNAGGCRVSSEEDFQGPLAILIPLMRRGIETRVTEFLSKLAGVAEATL